MRFGLFIALGVLVFAPALAIAQSNSIVVGSEFGRIAVGHDQTLHAFDSMEVSPGIHMVVWDGDEYIADDTDGDGFAYYARFDASGDEYRLSFTASGDYLIELISPPGPIAMDWGTW